MTPQVGAQTGAVESGAAGAGSGGNPDCGPGGNASYLQDKGAWSIGDGGMWCGPARPGPAFTPEELGLKPISEAHQPGYGTSKAPQFAPPAAIDQAGIADQRLKGMWGAQRFHGPAPGKQTGSLGCDDYRNPRLPLPSRPGAGWSIGGGGMWCGPALVPRGIDPGLLGLPGGGGGAPLLGNPTDAEREQNASLCEQAAGAPEGYFSREERSYEKGNGGSGGGVNGNAQPPENAPTEWWQSILDFFAARSDTGDAYEELSAADVYMDGFLGNLGFHPGRYINDFIDSHIYRNWSSAVASSISTNPGLMAATSGVGAASGAFLAAAGTAYGIVAGIESGIAGAVGNAARGAVNWLGAAARSAWSWLGTAAGTVGTWLQQTGQRIGSTVSGWGNAAASWGRSAWNQVVTYSQQARIVARGYLQNGPRFSKSIDWDHVFRTAKNGGHYINNSWWYRSLIRGAASDMMNAVNHGFASGANKAEELVVLYQETLYNGASIWAKVYQGVITNGGINKP